jgi:signal transduction histidine kinase
VAALTVGQLGHLALAVAVTTRTGCRLVRPDECHGMARKLRLPKTFRRVARSAVIPVVVAGRGLVAERAFVMQRLCVSLVAVKALGLGMLALQLHRMRPGIQDRPQLRRDVAVAAGHPRYRIVRADVASGTVGERRIQAAVHVAIQADVHGADHVPTDRIKAVAHGAVAVAAVDTHCLGVGELVVGCPQPVFEELVVLYESLRFYVGQITRAQEDERQRIARELHDETAQGLIELSRRVDALAVGPDDGQGKNATEHLELLQVRLEDLLQGVRRFSRDLRPSVLDDLGLLPALNGLLTELKDHGIEARLETEGESRRLGPDVELALFRIAQEAINNAKKHAQASGVVVSVEFHENRVRLTIRDDGQGFQLSGRTSDLVSLGRFGLAGMEERAYLLGGYLEVLSGLNAGTIVVADVPAPQE